MFFNFNIILSSAKLQLLKISDQYMFLSNDFKKQSKLLDYNQNNSPSSTPVQHLTLNLQKLEKKCFQSQEEYRQANDKYNQARTEYEKRFTESCHVFEAQEKAHLRQMRIFIQSYTQLVAQLNSTRQKNFNESQQKLNNVYTTDTLLEQLILTKSTGFERPEKAEFFNPFLTKRFDSGVTNSDTALDTASTRFNNKKTVLADETRPTSEPASEVNNTDPMTNSTQTIDSPCKLILIYTVILQLINRKIVRKLKFNFYLGRDEKKNESKIFGLFNFIKAKKDQTAIKPTHSKQPSTDISDKEKLDSNSKQLERVENLFSAFDSQITELEKHVDHKSKLSTNSIEESKFYVGSFNTKSDQVDSFSSSVFNQSSLSEIMSSLGSQLIDSKRIPISNNKKEAKVAGSLVTATSLDSNNNFLSDSSTNKNSLNFLEPSQEEEDFFAQFDDINFESINQINLDCNGYFCF